MARSTTCWFGNGLPLTVWVDTHRARSWESRLADTTVYLSPIFRLPAAARWIPRLDEEVRSGAHAVLLGGAEFEDGHIEGDGHRFLREFRLDCLIPTWTFEIPREGAGGNHHSVLEKRIVMPHTLNTVYVEYRLISGGLMHL